MYNGLSQVYCTIPEGIIHWYTKSVAVFCFLPESAIHEGREYE